MIMDNICYVKNERIVGIISNEHESKEHVCMGNKQSHSGILTFCSFGKSCMFLNRRQQVSWSSAWLFPCALLHCHLFVEKEKKILITHYKYMLAVTTAGKMRLLSRKRKKAAKEETVNQRGKKIKRKRKGRTIKKASFY